MPYPSLHIPSYRHHKARGIAVVTLNGQDIYLGPYGSKESRQEYDRLITEWLASGRTRTADRAVDEEAFSVAELMVAYLEHAKIIYRKDGEPTSHLHNIEDAMSYLTRSDLLLHLFFRPTPPVIRWLDSLATGSSDVKTEIRSIVRAANIAASPFALRIIVWVGIVLIIFIRAWEGEGRK